MKQILVATDGSESAYDAVSQAIELARSTGAKLVVAYVRHAPLPLLGEPVYQRSLSSEVRLGQETTALAAARACGVGVPAEVEVVEGNPAERILELARIRDVDLIVVGSRKLGALASTLLGSVSREVLRHAARPVLVATRRAARSSRAA